MYIELTKALYSLAAINQFKRIINCEELNLAVDVIAIRKL